VQSTYCPFIKKCALRGHLALGSSFLYLVVTTTLQLSLVCDTARYGSSKDVRDRMFAATAPGREVYARGGDGKDELLKRSAP
jgi:hypothetical protein